MKKIMFVPPLLTSLGLVLFIFLNQANGYKNLSTTQWVLIFGLLVINILSSILLAKVGVNFEHPEKTQTKSILYIGTLTVIGLLLLALVPILFAMNT